MEKKHFSLEMRENNRLIMIFQVLFGLTCVAIAIYWFIYNARSVNPGSTLWVTVIFLTGFGAYLIWSGFGYGIRFIEFTAEKIILKKNAFLSAMEIYPADVEMIEIYPLKFIVKFRSSKRILTRFGVSDIEKIELIKDEIIKFAADHNILLEIKNEL
ncbi:MAG: hypothetical protein ABR974_00665 [Bacteroidales bacterium]|jgi:hypothetical protein